MDEKVEKEMKKALAIKEEEPVDTKKQDKSVHFKITDNNLDSARTEKYNQYSAGVGTRVMTQSPTAA